MGREIRRVPWNWEHPKKEVPNYRTGRMEESFQPLYNHPFEEAADEWLKEFHAWESGKDNDCDEHEAKEGHRVYYWEWNGGPPDREYHRPSWTQEEATWFQVYETVSEGTPVTPPFATKEELIDYLVANGDYWDQHRGDGGWSRENAEKFVGTGFAVSMVVHRTGDSVEIKMPRDGQFEQQSPPTHE